MTGAGRRRAWLLALLAWVAVIWGHSLLGGDVSGRESGIVVEVLRPVFELVGVTDENLMSFVVRKCAHFSEYTVLGIVVYGNIRVAGSRASAGAFLLAGLAVAPLDESLQLLVPGRSGMLRDVLIDLAGLAVGLTLSGLLARRSRSL